MLGWEPRVDYAAGLEATLAWLRSGQLEPAQSSVGTRVESGDSG